MVEALWDNFWKDKNGDVVVFQKPNLWIIAWFVLAVISILSYGGFSHTVSRIATGVLVIWAILEIVQGATYFRRTLGVLVLLVSLGSAFGIGL